jgi:sugar lactone lactonase YvrE
LLFSSKEPIEGKIARLVNSIAVTDDAKTLYWTTSSTEADLEDGLLSVLGDPSGRLFKYDIEKKTHTLLLDNIHFANGLALSKKEDFIIVSETVRGRLFRYNFILLLETDKLFEIFI